MGVRGLHVLRLIIDIIANIETEVNVRVLNTYVDKSSCPLHSSLGYSKEAKRQGESSKTVKDLTSFGQSGFFCAGLDVLIH